MVIRTHGGKAVPSDSTMTSSRDGSWVEDLVRALARVHKAEGGYVEEIAERRLERERMERSDPWHYPVSDPVCDLRSFYDHVCGNGGRDFESRYAPLREALREAEKIVSAGQS